MIFNVHTNACEIITNMTTYVFDIQEDPVELAELDSLCNELIEIRETCLRLMLNEDISDESLTSTVNRISTIFIKKLLDEGLIELLDRFTIDDKVGFITAEFKHQDHNWSRIIILITLGRHDLRLAPYIASHIAPWIHLNGGFDELIKHFAYDPNNVRITFRTIITEFIIGFVRLIWT